VNLAFFILYVFVMYKAFKGERFALPVYRGVGKQEGLLTSYAVCVHYYALCVDPQP
jgi:uncharacterized membrane protein